MTKLTAAQKRAATRAANQAAAEVQAKAENRAFNIERMRQVRPTKPTRTYKVGDKVTVGNLHEMTVIEVFDDGIFYECHYDYMGKSYGKPVRKTGNDFWHWFDLQTYILPEVEAAKKSFSKSDNTRLNFSQRQISSLLHTYYSGNLDMSPDYQRGSVWTQAHKELLINSIFENRDIGKFVFIKRPYAPWPAPHDEILDGKQRLAALVEFYENRFPYKGVCFDDLSRRDQSHFESFCVSWAELNERTTRKQKLEYFLRLNVAGVPQDPAHLDYVKKLLEAENGKSSEGEDV